MSIFCQAPSTCAQRCTIGTSGCRPRILAGADDFEFQVRTCDNAPGAPRFFDSLGNFGKNDDMHEGMSAPWKSSEDARNEEMLAKLDKNVDALSRELHESGECWQDRQSVANCPSTMPQVQTDPSSDAGCPSMPLVVPSVARPDSEGDDWEVLKEVVQTAEPMQLQRLMNLLVDHGVPSPMTGAQNAPEVDAKRSSHATGSEQTEVLHTNVHIGTAEILRKSHSSKSMQTLSTGVQTLNSGCGQTESVTNEATITRTSPSQKEAPPKDHAAGLLGWLRLCASRDKDDTSARFMPNKGCRPHCVPD